MLTGLVLGAFAAQVDAGELCFQWPMGRWQGGEIVPGYGIYVMQQYDHYFPDYAKYHAGVDLSYDTGASTAVSAPVYATADGVVSCVANPGDPGFAGYPGAVIVLEHTLEGGGKVYSQYGHLETSSLSEGQWVSAGTQIGTLIYQGTNGDNTHLHFEIRSFAEWNGTCWGPGYADTNMRPGQQGWYDPVDWIYQHRPPFPGTVVADFETNVRSAPSLNASIVGTLPVDTRKPVNSVHADQDGNDHWWYLVEYSSGSYGYCASYWESDTWGGNILVSETPRSCEGSGDCRDYDGNVTGCNAAPSCAYYFCSSQCHPVGTTNCDAGCTSYCSDSCRDYDGDVSGCNAAPDCSYYTCSNQCHPTGTTNCDAGCTSYCTINCRDYDFNITGCNAAPSCSYYLCSDQCHPTGTTNCDAGCTSYC
jgi:murein DD-endopeptidase MepM/ murein hydrolase activator NlpD